MDPLAEVETALETVSPYVPAPLWPWLIVAIGACAAIGAHALLWRFVERLLRRRRGLLPHTLRRLRRPSRLFLLVLVSGILVNVAGLPNDWETWLSHASVATLIVIAGWTIVVALDTACIRFLAKLGSDGEDDIGARKQVTQVRMVQRIGRILIYILTAGLVLSTFESVRQFGISLFASAGAAGLVLGFAARPVLANLIAGIQIALTQPIRLNDVVIVEGEWGWIEEIASTYVVVRVWDLRRLVIPLSYFIEQPFENWTRDNAKIIGSVLFHLDYTAPMAAIRAKVEEVIRGHPLWDGDVAVLQVIEAERDVVQIRALMSARSSPVAWDLRCAVREEVLTWLQAAHPGALPRVRAEVSARGAETAAMPGGPGEDR